MDAPVQIGLVRENLALAMALWAAAEKGVITAGFVPNRSEFVTADGRVVRVNTPLEIHDPKDLVRCVNNQMRGAFAFSAIQTNRVLESVYGNSPIRAAPSDLQAARCILYLMSKSVSGDLMAPTWVCPPEYRRRFGIQAVSFVLDASHLDGQRVCWDHFGGLQRYLDLLEFCSVEVASCPVRVEDAGDAPPGPGGSPDGLVEDPPAPAVAPALVSIPVLAGPQTFRPQAAVETPATASDQGNGAADPIAAFVETGCQVSPREMVIAKDLYDGYVAWCRELGQEPLAQRSFGMGLTALGFQRRRRGRGRHWWLGICLRPCP